MEQDKRGRGRPKIDTHITEAYASRVYLRSRLICAKWRK